MSTEFEVIGLLSQQEPVVHPQVHGGDRHVGHRRQPAALPHALRHRRDAERLLLVQQPPQRLVHPVLALLRRQVEDRQILRDRSRRHLAHQEVVSHPESAGREHRVPIAVRLEGARLAHQPVDDVAVLDPVLAPAPQPR
jgi:hypothetical protein